MNKPHPLGMAALFVVMLIWWLSFGCALGLILARNL